MPAVSSSHTSSHTKSEFERNPYSSWIHDYPERLLPEPTPALLAARRGAGPPGSGRLIVELGSGAGNFLLNLARENPGDHLVGFELRFKRLVKAARKLERGGMESVWLLRERAENFPAYFAPGSVDRVYLNFPDPWPKPSQWKKRLLSQAMLRGLGGALKEGGTFHLKTDSSGYFLHCLSLFRNSSGWVIQWFSNDLYRGALTEPNVATEFEQLFTNQRRAIFALIIKHTGGGGETLTGLGSPSGLRRNGLVGAPELFPGRGPGYPGDEKERDQQV